ncbi:MFS-type transporter [Paramyrothecium foliicola]|nr:MFS-type transporter [Paramyrothecium foliicola]
MWPFTGSSSTRPVLLSLRSSSALIVTTASFAVFTDIFLYAVIVPVLPFSLEDRLDVPPHRVQYWVSVSLAVYGAALLASSPIWGLFADRIQNRRIPMLSGLVLLTAATVFLCLSKNVAMLLVGRVLQGLSAALTWTVGLALVIDTVDRSQIGVATGWVGMATSIGVLIAPLLGGVVYNQGGYYSVFAMCFGLLAVDIVLRLAIIETKDARRWLEAPTQDTNASGSPKKPDNVEAGRKEAVPEADGAVDDQTVTPAPVPAPAPARSLSLRPMLQLLRKPRLLAALWGTLVHGIVQTAFDSTLPLFVESIFGWNSTGAGLVFLPLVMPAFLSPLIGFFGDKYGPKWLAAAGYFLATPFLICLRFVDEDSMAHKVMLCGLLAGVGVAIALVFGPLMAEISWAVQDGHEDDAVEPYALAYGLWNMSFSGGTLLGPIMGGMIRDTAGWGTVGWSLGLVTFVTAFTQAMWIGGPLSIKHKRENPATTS